MRPACFAQETEFVHNFVSVLTFPLIKTYFSAQTTTHLRAAPWFACQSRCSTTRTMSPSGESWMRRGRGHGAVSRGAFLDVPGCSRSKLTVWKEDKFTVRPRDGQREREKRLTEIRKRELSKAKPGKWGCVQARELWSTKEEIHLRPGHHWLFEFGDAGDGTCVETVNGQKTFSLPPRKWVEHKGVRFYNGDSALVVRRWLHRVDEDASGLSFVEWDPKAEADPEAPPVEMIVNSSELRAAGFSLREVLPPALESLARQGARTRGAGLRQLQGMGPTTFVLHVDTDSDLRSRCE